MFPKQLFSLSASSIAMLLAISILVSLGVIFFLDRAMIASNAGQEILLGVPQQATNESGSATIETEQ